MRSQTPDSKPRVNSFDLQKIAATTSKTEQPFNMFQVKKEETKFKLERKKFSKFVGSRTPFLQFYSNGPLSKQILKGKNYEFRNNFAVKIQKVWRGYVVRKMYEEGSYHHYELLMARKQRLLRQ